MEGRLEIADAERVSVELKVGISHIAEIQAHGSALFAPPFGISVHIAHGRSAIVEAGERKAAEEIATWLSEASRALIAFEQTFRAGSVAGASG